MSLESFALSERECLLAIYPDGQVAVLKALDKFGARVIVDAPPGVRIVKSAPFGALVLKRKKGELIRLCREGQPDVRVAVVDRDGTRIGIDGPHSIQVHRDEFKPAAEPTGKSPR